MKSAKTAFFSLLIAVAALLAAADAFAQVEDGCTEEILLSYYPEKFVAITLERFEIPQSQWSSIQNELKDKDKEVVPRVEEKAGKMTPNPLRDPQKRQQAIKIFRETLYELFADVMQAHGINKQEQIQAMLNDIQQQKARQFAQCVEQYHRPGKSPQQPQGKPMPSTPAQQQQQQKPQQQQPQQQQQQSQQRGNMQGSWGGAGQQTYYQPQGSGYYYPSYPATRPYPQ